MQLAFLFIVDANLFLHERHRERGRESGGETYLEDVEGPSHIASR